MLDAYIIDRIRRERTKREPSRLPLKVEIPDRPFHREGPSEEGRYPWDRQPELEEKSERGVVIIDFGI